MLEFAETQMGKQYFKSTLPRIAEGLENLVKAQEEQNRLARIALESQGVVVDENQCSACGCDGSCM